MLAISLTIQGADSGGSRLLKGRILDNEHNPLPGAVVILDGKAHSAVADADGFYSFLLVSGKCVYSAIFSDFMH